MCPQLSLPFSAHRLYKLQTHLCFRLSAHSRTPCLLIVFTFGNPCIGLCLIVLSLVAAAYSYSRPFASASLSDWPPLAHHCLSLPISDFFLSQVISTSSLNLNLNHPSTPTSPVSTVQTPSRGLICDDRFPYHASENVSSCCCCLRL